MFNDKPSAREMINKDEIQITNVFAESIAITSDRQWESESACFPLVFLRDSFIQPPPPAPLVYTFA